MTTSTIKIPASVARLTTKELHAKIAEVTGSAAPTSRNKPYLQRVLAKALAARPRTRPSRRATDVAEVIDAVNSGRVTPRTLGPRRAPAPAKAVDPRLPPIGSFLTREHEGRTHKVRVLEGGVFSYGGTTYKSLSTIAKIITGTIWNGFLFFHLTPYPVRNKHVE